MLLIRFVVARIEILTNAFSLDFLGFGMYTFPAGEAGAMSFHDSHEVSIRAPLRCAEGSYGY